MIEVNIPKGNETARFIEARISNIFIVCNSCDNNPFSKKSSAFCDIQNPIKKVTNPIKDTMQETFHTCISVSLLYFLLYILLYI